MSLSFLLPWIFPVQQMHLIKDWERERSFHFNDTKPKVNQGWPLYYSVKHIFEYCITLYLNSHSVIYHIYSSLLCFFVHALLQIFLLSQNLTLFQHPPLFWLHLFMHLCAIYFKYAHDHRWYSPQRHSEIEIKRKAFAGSLQTTLRTFAQEQQVLHDSPALDETKNIKYTTWAQQRKSILYWNVKTYFD